MFIIAESPVFKAIDIFISSNIRISGFNSEWGMYVCVYVWLRFAIVRVDSLR
jgi:hypothetical protein